MRKPSRKTLKNKADKLWSEIIRSKGKCEVCGKPANNPHHIIGRKNLTLRWDLRNGCLLCFQHHTGGNQSAHNDSQWFLNEWMVNNRTLDYNYLWEKKTELSTNIDYNAIIEELTHIKRNPLLGTKGKRGRGGD
jgi:hypothetical protein